MRDRIGLPSPDSRTGGIDTLLGTDVGWFRSSKHSGRRADCATFLSLFTPTERSEFRVYKSR